MNYNEIYLITMPCCCNNSMTDFFVGILYSFWITETLITLYEGYTAYDQQSLILMWVVVFKIITIWTGYNIYKLFSYASLIPLFPMLYFLGTHLCQQMSYIMLVEFLCFGLWFVFSFPYAILYLLDYPNRQERYRQLDQTRKEMEDEFKRTDAERESKGMGRRKHMFGAYE